MAEQATVMEQEQSTRAGKYLTFGIADEEYGLEILKVREIIGIMEITSVPKTPPYVKGVINLRGKVIPVIDLRLKVGMPEADRTDQTCIIIVDVDNVEMGIIVDNVSEVLDIPAEDIDDSPSFGEQVNTDYILGMGKSDGNVTILLDISKLLSQTNVTAIEATSSPTQATPAAEVAPPRESEPAREEPRQPEEPEQTAEDQAE